MKGLWTTDNRYSFGDLPAVLVKVYSVICPWWLKKELDLMRLYKSFPFIRFRLQIMYNDRQDTACPRDHVLVVERVQIHNTPISVSSLPSYCFSALCLPSTHVLFFRLYRSGSQPLPNVQGLSSSKVGFPFFFPNFPIFSIHLQVSSSKRHLSE